MHTPYVYELTDLETGKRYIGCRFAKECTPEDLGVTYFTSSDIVRPLFVKNPSRFTKAVLYTGVISEVRAKETELLKLYNAATSEEWYNRTDAEAIPRYACVAGGKKSGKLIGAYCRDNGIGIFGMSAAAKKLNAIAAAKRTVELRIGAHARTSAQKALDGRKGGLLGGKKGGEVAKRTGQIYMIASIGGKVGGKVSTSQRYKCAVCGLVASPGTLGRHQKYKNHAGRTRVA